ncbi:hypothetical protein [Rhizobium azibense]|uniref:Uncharacterized protein n=1 Tax=Rhizobium azibense TaxID=1136135 RepID=A0A4R3RR96_9HYPH|nr:hypothetical protein [Rhizobium azibense]TCU34116.1 hypothetical protein EV129_113100 [Rhizobium azibense]
MANQSEVHNENVGKIVKSIISPVIMGGGSLTDVMVLMESVIVGVSLACIKLGGDELVLDIMLKGAKARLAEIRLKNIETKGEA